MTDSKNVRITDYTLIGNCRSAALVSKYGSIDWCCIPEFHSPSIFTALLDQEMGGSFQLQPGSSYEASQNYIDHTNVVETWFSCAEGTVKITDCFVALEEKDKQAQIFPDHEILRIVEGIEGTVKMSCKYAPKVFYGKAPAKLTNYNKLGIHFAYKESIVVFQTTVQGLELNSGHNQFGGDFTISKHEKEVFSISCSSQYPAIIPEIKSGALSRVQSTIDYWSRWISKCTYEGVFAPWVLRSVLTLKLLTHAPSGAIIAAPTTSLPEEINGVRNWDYRYCWLRDASFTVRALIKLGYEEEAHAYMNWILHATRLSQPKLQVVYTVFGDTKIGESICDWLKGYKNSAPVRIGNNAYGQFQLDIYGEVLDAIFTYDDIVDEFDKGTVRFVIGLGKTICKTWDQPDDGIWEIRSTPLQHTHSKVMAWVALDRLIKLCKKYNWTHAPLDDFTRTKEDIDQSIKNFGIDKALNTFKKNYDNSELDASLLTFSLVEYCDAGSPEMVSTVEQIKQQLMHHNFVYRRQNADDGIPGKEGAFVIANFWLIENLAKSGRIDEAIDMFQKTVSVAPQHGLLSEEINPDTKEWLGNYPQGFSHIGLITAAITITEQLARSKQEDGNR
jgi:GH15 family glucan-1,4-alpha-glucosidase